MKVKENQKDAIIELRSNKIDYILIPQGIKPKLRRFLVADNISTFQNAPNQMFFLGFNLRRPPMDSKAFRQAVSTLIDREFIAKVIFSTLDGLVLPMYTVVPEGNKFWSNSDVRQFGRDLSREQRIKEAVALLKGAGFTWGKEPKFAAGKVQPGEGLRMPDGQLVPEMEVLPPGEGFDFMRTAAEWTERWLTEVGIPVKANLTDEQGLLARLRRDFPSICLSWGVISTPLQPTCGTSSTPRAP